MIGLVRIPSALTRRKLWIFTIVIIASLVVSVYAYAFTSLRRSPATCPPLHWGSGNQGATNLPFSIVPVGELYRPELGTGTISWCVYSNSGVLERSYQTNRILGSTASSADGQYLAAAGYKVSSGPGGFYGYRIRTTEYRQEDRHQIRFPAWKPEIGCGTFTALISRSNSGSYMLWLEHRRLNGRPSFRKADFE